MKRIKRYKLYEKVRDDVILFKNRSTEEFEVGQRIMLLPSIEICTISAIKCFQPSLIDEIGFGAYLELIRNSEGGNS